MRCAASILPALVLWLGFFTIAAGANPQHWQHEWPDTDFDRTTISDWREIMSGGPPKDGIPAIDNPTFQDVADKAALPGREPVMTLEMPGERPRAYPLRYLMWHEIVNDSVGGVPVAVTYCPLCNSGLTFERRVAGQELSFGVSGKLRHSDMIMYDRETESWWQQAIGKAIVGEMTGAALTPLPSWMESWDQFKARNPEGLVMAQPPFNRQYGRNPYRGYDTNPRPFLYSGEDPPHGISPVARVVRVGDRAWPLTRIREEGGVTEAGVSISWESGQASAMDHGVIAQGRDVGTVRVRDAAGQDVPHDLLFAFAFHAFWPDGTWMLGE
jgi:hypothetical protein